MEAFSICGGRPLSGEIRAYGAKNAVLPLLAACMLVKGPVRLTAARTLRTLPTCCGCSRAWAAARRARGWT